MAAGWRRVVWFVAVARGIGREITVIASDAIRRKSNTDVGENDGFITRMESR
jgi:hypothetical protein